MRMMARGMEDGYPRQYVAGDLVAVCVVCECGDGGVEEEGEEDGGADGGGDARLRRLLQLVVDGEEVLSAREGEDEHRQRLQRLQRQRHVGRRAFTGRVLAGGEGVGEDGVERHGQRQHRHEDDGHGRSEAQRVERPQTGQGQADGQCEDGDPGTPVGHERPYARRLRAAHLRGEEGAECGGHQVANDNEVGACDAEALDDQRRVDEHRRRRYNAVRHRVERRRRRAQRAGRRRQQQQAEGGGEGGEEE